MSNSAYGARSKSGESNTAQRLVDRHIGRLDVKLRSVGVSIVAWSLRRHLCEAPLSGAGAPGSWGDTHMNDQAAGTVSVGEEVVNTLVVARARWAITGVFFVNGLLIATYLVRIPSLKAGLGLTEPRLAAVLTCFSVAALLAMQSVGGLVARFGSVRVI